VRSFFILKVQADASGHLTASVDCRPSAGKRRVQMKLYNDLQLTADGAWKQQSCLLTTECEIGSEEHHVTLSADVDPSILQLWTAETPYLYTVTLSLVSDDQTIHQVESCRVGFRTVDIHDGAVHVNGRPITVCGMNRHEHDPGTSAVSSQLFVCPQFHFSHTLFDSYRSR
jgi:beta-galactosidase/beta-glucuronidase